MPKKTSAEEIKTPDFGQIPFALICRFDELTKFEIRVLCVLYAARNDKTGRCHPRRKKIAGWTRIDGAHLSRAVAGLESKGWIMELETKEFLLIRKPPPPEKVAESATKFESKKAAAAAKKVAESATENAACFSPPDENFVAESAMPKVADSATENNPKKLRNRQQKVAESAKKNNKDLNIKRTYKTKPLSEPSSDAFVGFDFKVDVEAYEVFAEWQKVLNKQKSRYDEKRQKLILRAREKFKFSVEDLKKAIKGVSFSPFHLGKTANNSTKYLELKTIFRDTEQIEKFRDLAEESEAIQEPPKASPTMSDQEQIFRQMMRDSAKAVTAK